MTLNRPHKNLEDMEIQSLKKNDVFRFKGSRAGQMISCVEGMIWITQQGDGFDWILTAGERFHTRIPGYVVVEAIKDSRIMISPQEKVGVVEHLPFPTQKEVACPC